MSIIKLVSLSWRLIEITIQTMCLKSVVGFVGVPVDIL